MKGVAIPSVSPGSSQREASVMWTPQVMVPAGPAGAAAAGPATPKPRTIATKAVTTREVHDLMGSSQWRISRQLLPRAAPCGSRRERMTTIDPLWATVAELSRAFGARTLSPVDAVEALIGRIRRRNPALHAYIAVYEADARLAAEAADKAIRAGHRVGPLHGVPIALKDLVDLEGRVTTGGSKGWAERVSPVTATLAERLIAAGMIVLGKTHTVEFAMGSWGTNTHMGARAIRGTSRCIVRPAARPAGRA